MSKKIHILSIIAAAMLWGIISIFSSPLKIAGINPQTITSIRSLGAVIILWLIFGIKDRNLLKINIKDIWMFIGTGIVSFVFFNCCYFTALEKTTTAVSVILLYTSPIFVIIFSAILFKEKLTSIKITALVITIIGCCFVSGAVGGKLNGSVFGIVCGIGSGFFYGLYSIFGRYALNKYSSVTVTLYTFLFAAIASLFIADYSQIGILFSEYDIVISGLMLIAFSTVLPFLLYTFGLSNVETGVAAILATIEPVVGVAAGLFYFGESPSVFKITGIVMVIGAVILLNIKRENIKKEKRSNELQR